MDANFRSSLRALCINKRDFVLNGFCGFAFMSVIISFVLNV